MIEDLKSKMQTIEDRIARLNSLVKKSNNSSVSIDKTKKCQPDAGDRPDLIQTEPVPSTGLARQTNYLSTISRVQVTKNTKTKSVSRMLGTGRI